MRLNRSREWVCRGFSPAQCQQLYRQPMTSASGLVSASVLFGSHLRTILRGKPSLPSSFHSDVGCGNRKSWGPARFNNSLTEEIGMLKIICHKNDGRLVSF